MECDLALNSIDLVISSESNQDVNKSSSEESGSTLSTINTPVENVNRTFSKLDLKDLNEDDIKYSPIINKDIFKSPIAEIKENLIKESQSLHWFNKKERFNNVTNCLPIDKNIKPGEFVLKTLFAEFAIIVEKKIDAVLSQESAEKPLSKLLQRGEDVIFDQLLSAFGSVAEHCLPSLLKTLFAWYDRQLNATQSILEQKNQNNDSQSKATGKTVFHESSEKNETICLLEKRDLCIEFIFCLFMIEVLKQLPLHPGHEELINNIETIAFKHFKYVERSQNDINIQNYNIIADLYAEVIGVLAQSRFQSVRKRFINELNELRLKEPSPFVTYSIISLLMGMKFFRIKMVPIQEFEASFQFMQECALYFLELKDKDIKHALAGLFVEILVPVAATVKTEVNVTCLKNFVEMLFTPTLDLCTKKKHMLAICPLVTCLLCVSQKTFFIQNWHYFLVICLSNLKNRDQKISRVALESLYRLLWVYMIRIKCESNTATQSKLHSIVNSLFPKGSKAVVPRDTPLNIFVKIIQFIAQERLDFAMKEIVFDLLSVGRHFKIIMTPERMSIGLRAFLVVADSLQQKEGEPPMPRISILPSGNAQRVKKTYLAKLLTDDVAKSIGLSQYYPHVKKVLNDILKALDAQFGKPLLKTIVQNTNKEFDDMITAERKPKIDLFRTCIAAIPRLIPEGMNKQQLINLLSRLTIHIDDELSGLAFQSLQNIINDFINWREDVIDCFINFISNEVNDTFPQLIENSLRILLQLLTSWKLSLHQSNKNKNLKDVNTKLSENKNNSNSIIVLNKTEAISVMMLCSCRQPTRRLAALILKETRSLFSALFLKTDDEPVLDIIDRICPSVVENCPAHLITPSERQILMSTSFNVDLQWLADRVSSSWVNETLELDPDCKIPLSETEPKLNAWSACLMDFLSEISSKKNLTSYYAWYMTNQRMNSLFLLIESNNISDNRASVLLRGAASNLKRNPNEKDDYLSLWKNYLMLVCRIAPSSSSLIQLQRNFPNEISSSPDSVCSSDRSIENKFPYSFSLNSSQLFKTVLPLLRNEQNYLKSATTLGLSNINSNAVIEMLNELNCFLKEAIDRKQENMRRRKRRDLLRLQLGKLLCQIAEKKTFGKCSLILDNETGNLTSILIEYIKGMCLFLKNEGNKELDPQITEIKQQFCIFVTKLIDSFSAEKRMNLITKDLRESLFNLFAFFSGNVTSNLFLSNNLSSKHRNNQNEINNITDLNLCALQSMCSVLCCGPVFSKNCLVEESPYFDWLYLLLDSQDERLRNLAQEAITLLLEFNPDVSPLLDWLVDCCFTKNSQVADICFIAMATIFRIREYPCDRYISIINVTLLNVGCPRSSIHQIAMQLLHQLDYRFFDTCSKSVFNSENVNDTSYKPINDLIEENTEENFSKNEPLLKTDQVLPENENLEENGKHSPIQYRQKAENNSSLSNQIFEPLLNNLFVANQYDLSKRLASLHPEITMPMFSEITYRFQTARPSVCQNLLTYLVPWLFNMELVDSHLPAQGNIMCLIENNKEGWGSIEATEMVLNNLFYITVKFGDLYPSEIENLWIALTSLWLNNMRVVIRYLFIITGLSPTELLPFSKRVAIFMVHAKPEHLIDELMYELQTVESLNCVIERTETPPFYRITNNRKCSSHSDEEEITLANEITTSTVIKVEQGTLHTKRHSTESSERLLSESIFQQNKNDHLGFINSKTNNVFKTTPSNQDPQTNSSAKLPLNEDNSIFSNRTAENIYCRMTNPQPHPLPMPEYGGFYAPLTEYLPDSSQPIIGFHRCNLALMLLSDIVLDGIQIDWTPHIPLMIHIIFLGLDHPRALVHEHCKDLFINLLLILTKQQNLLDVFKILANNQAQKLNYGLSLNTSLEDSSINFIDPPSFKISNRVLSKSSSRKSSLSRNKNIYFNLKQEIFEKDSNSSLNSFNTQKNQSCVSYKNKDNLEVLIMNLINFLSSRANKQLWNCEDITAKVWNIRSADQISFFIEHVLKALKTTLPIGHIPERWAEIALQLALSCSSRHYAGRSLQIFRAIKIPINSRTLSDILSRLIETVAEQGEDMQGYVTELMLTLESAVDTLSSDQVIISDFVKNLFKSTPCLEKEPNRKSAPVLGSSACQLIRNQHTNQSMNSMKNIYSSGINRRINVEDNFNKNLNSVQSNSSSKIQNSNYQARYRSNTESDIKSNFKNNYSSKYNSTNLNRSRSVQSLKLQEQTYLTPEDRNTLIVQLFMISIAMLETDYEHEFLLALRLLDKVLKNLQLDSKDTQEKIEKILLQSKWNNFQGLHTMLLKGVTSTTTYEPTIMLLHQLTPFLEIPIIDPSDVTNSFPFNVMALLPYMLLNYDEPDSLCTKAAEQIARWCTEKSNKLENLATVMTLYSRRSFSKECLQWTKCVVKYLHDAYSHAFFEIITFLTEVSEKGPSNLIPHIISILNCILDYVDINLISPAVINNDLNKIVSKYVEGTQYKDSLKIIKHIVTRSSTLAAPPSYSSSLSSNSTNTNSGLNSISSSINYPPSLSSDCVIVASGVTFADGDGSLKHELPGRTMEFSFDLNQTPIVGRKLINKKENEDNDSDKKNENKEDNLPNENTSYSPKRSLSYTHSFNENSSNWRRPWSCQSRVRDKLIGILTSFGQKVGLPKSPSVIFSQNSDIIDRQSSLASSTEEVSAINNELSNDSKIEDGKNLDQFGLFKEFDFLEYELGCQEESMDNFNWGVRRKSLSNLANKNEQHEFDVRLGSPCFNTLTSHIIRKDTDLSSDEEVGSVSPLFNYNNELNLQELSPFMPNNISSSPSSVSSLSSTCSLTILKDL